MKLPSLSKIEELVRQLKRSPLSDFDRARAFIRLYAVETDFDGSIEVKEALDASGRRRYEAELDWNRHLNDCRHIHILIAEDAKGDLRAFSQVIVDLLDAYWGTRSSWNGADKLRASLVENLIKSKVDKAYVNAEFLSGATAVARLSLHKSPSGESFKKFVEGLLPELPDSNPETPHEK